MNLEFPCNKYLEASWMIPCTCKVVFSLNIIVLFFLNLLFCLICKIHFFFYHWKVRWEVQLLSSATGSTSPTICSVSSEVEIRFYLCCSYSTNKLGTSPELLWKLLFCYQSTFPCRVQSMWLAAKGHIHSTLLWSWHQRRQWNVDWPMVEFHVS